MKINRSLFVVVFIINTLNIFAQCAEPNASGSIVLKEIDAELCMIGKEDQQVRKKLIKAIRKKTTNFESIKIEMDSIDLKNQIYVSNLLDTHGWPDSLSKKANKAIFLVIDHANNPFAEKYFHLVKEKSDQRVIHKSHAATLEDRILMRSLQRQKYGTQTVGRKNSEGESVIYIWPVEDDDKIDELRSSVGLPKMNMYIKIMKMTMKQNVIWDKSLSIEDLNSNF